MSREALAGFVAAIVIIVVAAIVVGLAFGLLVNTFRAVTA